MKFDTYLALGDSVSLDMHPYQDAQKLSLVCKQEIGAASLLHRNDDSLHPEFVGRDLITMIQVSNHVNLCENGGTTEDLLKRIAAKELDRFTKDNVLVTITLGSNDLLAAYRAGGDRSGIFREMKKLQSRFDEAIRSLKAKLSKSKIVVTTVYDPTDGTGVMPTSAGYRGKMPVEYLSQFNESLRQTAQTYNLLVADVHLHFRGHGAECGSADQFWYLRSSPIEPSYRGASEIRRVWLQTIEPLL